MNELWELRVRLLLSIQRALLGEVTPNIRAVTAQIDTQTIVLHWIIDGEISDGFKRDLGVVARRLSLTLQRTRSRKSLSAAMHRERWTNFISTTSPTRARSSKLTPTVIPGKSHGGATRDPWGIATELMDRMGSGSRFAWPG